MKIGDRVAGRFEVVSRIATGPMSQVLRGRDLVHGTDVALKILTDPSDDASKRFTRETELLASIRHPALAKYVAHGAPADGTAFLAMEWIEGPTLRRVLRNGGALSVESALAVAARVAEALSALHARGIVHRDVKPGNVILRDGDPARATLIDLGIALGAGEATRVTAAGHVVGTLAFMAPEQATGAAVDARTDVHALGVMLFTTLTGQTPFRGPDERTILAKVVLVDPPPVSSLCRGAGRRVDALVAACLAKEPANRPSHAAEVLRALEDIVAHESVGARPASAPPGPAQLGHQELRVAATVFALTSGGLSDPSLADTQPGRAGRARARASIDQHGARFARLADGSIVVTVAEGHAATDIASRGAQLAMLVRSEWPRARIALVIGHRRDDAAMPVAEALDRAAALLDPAPEREGEIRIDETTAALLRGDYEIERTGAGMSLRERRAGPMRVSPRAFLGRVTRCVGRDRELSALRALADEAFTERAFRLAVLRGEAGAGKSLVRHSLAQDLAGASPRPLVWTGRSDAMRRAQPYGVLGDALVRALRPELGRDEGSIVTELERHLSARVGPRASAMARTLAELIEPREGGARDGAADDARLRAERIRSAWIELFVTIAAEAPLLLVLEDVQWADRPSIELVTTLALAARESPLMVLACSREVRADTSGPTALLASIAHQDQRLGPLAHAAASALVRNAVPDADPAALERVVRQAGGNPFFLEELTRALAEGRTELPASILASTSARLAQLSSEERRLLRAASTYGDAFWAQGVAQILDEREDDVALHLEGLAAREWVTAREVSALAGQREWTWRHAFVREAAYASWTPEDRAPAHLRASIWLEALPDAPIAVIARHAELGGDRERAAQLHERAAQVAFDRGDIAALRESAESAARCGLSGMALATASVRIAQVARWRGEPCPEQELERVRGELAPGSRVWFECSSELGVARAARGDGLALEAVALDMLSYDPHAPGAAEARVTLAPALVSLGAAGIADEMIRPFASARRRDDETASGLGAGLAHALAVSALAAGELERFVRETRRSHDLYALLGDEARAIARKGDLGYGYSQLGLYADAERALRACHERATARGLRTHTAGALHNLGHVLAMVGRLGEARAAERAAIEAFAGSGQHYHELASIAYLARIEILAGELELALALGDRVVERAGLAGLEPLLTMGLAARIEVRTQRGLAREVSEDGEMLVRRIASGARVESAAWLRLVAARWLFAVGDPRYGEHLRASREWLLARAAHCATTTYRVAFLEQVPEHAALLELAREAGR